MEAKTILIRVFWKQAYFLGLEREKFCYHIRQPAVVLFSYVYRNICCFSECYILSIIIGESALKLKRGFFMLKSILIGSLTYITI